MASIVDPASDGKSAHSPEAVAQLLAPGDPDARMYAYYYGFERTGVGIIDAILTEVARAGKGSHSTESWANEGWDGGPSYEERIQAAADRAAAALRNALAGDA